MALHEVPGIVVRCDGLLPVPGSTYETMACYNEHDGRFYTRREARQVARADGWYVGANGKVLCPRGHACPAATPNGGA